MHCGRQRPAALMHSLALHCTDPGCCMWERGFRFSCVICIWTTVPSIYIFLALADTQLCISHGNHTNACSEQIVCV